MCADSTLFLRDKRVLFPETIFEEWKLPLRTEIEFGGRRRALGGKIVFEQHNGLAAHASISALCGAVDTVRKNWSERGHLLPAENRGNGEMKFKE